MALHPEPACSDKLSPLDPHLWPCTLNPANSDKLSPLDPAPCVRVQLMDRLQNQHKFGLMAVSLGYFDTLMSLSSASTSSELSDEEKLKSGISRGYVRLSIGITGGGGRGIEGVTLGLGFMGGRGGTSRVRGYYYYYYCG